MATTLIGADPASDVRIDHPRISSRHARLSLRGQEYVLEDLDSTNGTFVDGVRIKSTSVGPRSEIRLGPVPVQFSELSRLLPAPTASASPRVTELVEEPMPQRPHAAPVRAFTPATPPPYVAPVPPPYVPPAPAPPAPVIVAAPQYVPPAAPVIQQKQGVPGVVVAGFIFAFLFWPLGFLLCAMGYSEANRRQSGVGLAVAGIIISVIVAIIEVNILANM